MLLNVLLILAISQTFGYFSVGIYFFITLNLTLTLNLKINAFYSLHFKFSVHVFVFQAPTIIVTLKLVEEESQGATIVTTNHQTVPVPEMRVYKDKKEMMEGFRDLLKEHNVASNASWEQCLKLVQADPRYDQFRKVNEKKQWFNAYKTQRQKEEKEEGRLKAKKAKENLEEYLLSSDRITSSTKYYKCDEIFTNLEVS